MQKRHAIVAERSLNERVRSPPDKLSELGLPPDPPSEPGSHHNDSRNGGLSVDVTLTVILLTLMLVAAFSLGIGLLLLMTTVRF